jgi:glycosyltransferase involved in cell wall biosynthesis
MRARIPHTRFILDQYVQRQRPRAHHDPAQDSYEKIQGSSFEVPGSRFQVGWAVSGPSVVLIVPGRLETPTGGYEYDRRMVAGLRARGWDVDVRELEDSFPEPTVAALDDAARQLAATPAGALVLVDGLALGAMPDQVERESRRLRLVALVHMPLSTAVGLEAAAIARLRASESRALAAVSRAIVTSRSTAAVLRAYGLADDRIALVEPGTDHAPLARGSQSAFHPAAGDHPVELLCVATVNAGKGHDVLLGALAAISDGAWHLTCAGSLDRDPSTVDHVRALVSAHGLADRVSLVGAQHGAAIEACWDRADLFVLATYSETYGMAVAEALAHGLPVVSTTTGAIPELVGNDAGVLVPPGDADALAKALSRALDPGERERLAAGARRVRDRLPTWDDAFNKMAAVLERVATRG